MSNIRKNFLAFISVIYGLFFGGLTTVSAQTLTNPLDAENITELLTGVLDVVAQIALPLVVLAIIYTGFLFVRAQGNEQKLQEAKNSLFWTIIGAIVLLGASVLVSAIEGTVDALRSGIVEIILA